MNRMDHGRATGARPSPAWLFSFAVALALGAAGCAGAGRSAYDAPPLDASQIREAQQGLSDRGLNVQPTGKMDQPTRVAITEFQASRGLPQTGRLDYTTARMLGVNLDPVYNCEINDTVDCGPGGGA